MQDSSDSKYLIQLMQRYSNKSIRGHLQHPHIHLCGVCQHSVYGGMDLYRPTIETQRRSPHKDIERFVEGR